MLARESLKENVPMKHIGICSIVATLLVCGCGQSPQVLRDQALGEFQAGNTQLARQLFQQILDSRPSDSHALFYMGRIMETEGSYVQAIYYYQCSYDADPSNREAAARLEETQLRAGIVGPKLRFIPG